MILIITLWKKVDTYIQLELYIDEDDTDPFILLIDKDSFYLFAFFGEIQISNLTEAQLNNVLRLEILSWTRFHFFRSIFRFIDWHNSHHHA